MTCCQSQETHQNFLMNELPVSLYNFMLTPFGLFVNHQSEHELDQTGQATVYNFSIDVDCVSVV